ncbi:MAG TPA: DbpA RNA binding domain-containing protein, partial [Burkholderiaceae bacterium]|nr:DbpA RNA binding domain-containing protein [Burkholderiaceae bacterium]
KTLQADAAQDEEHIPSVDLTRVREPWAKKGKGPGSFVDKAAGKGKFKGASHKGDGQHKVNGQHKADGPRKAPARQQAAGPMVRVYVGAGSALGVRPADLVGAIANEAGVSSREIGAIEIEERFSLVEVSGEIADAAIRALRNTSLRGQRVTVRKDQPKRSTRPDGGK